MARNLGQYGGSPFELRPVDQYQPGSILAQAISNFPQQWMQMKLQSDKMAMEKEKYDRAGDINFIQAMMPFGLEMYKWNPDAAIQYVSGLNDETNTAFGDSLVENAATGMKNMTPDREAFMQLQADVKTKGATASPEQWQMWDEQLASFPIGEITSNYTVGKYADAKTNWESLETSRDMYGSLLDHSAQINLITPEEATI